MPSNVYNWVTSFLTGREQMCKVYNTLSKAVRIKMSIVQGSRFGPSLYVIMEIDLHPKSSNDKLMK